MFLSRSMLQCVKNMYIYSILNVFFRKCSECKQITGNLAIYCSGIIVIFVITRTSKNRFVPYSLKADKKCVIYICIYFKLASSFFFLNRENVCRVMVCCQNAVQTKSNRKNTNLIARKI